MQIKGHTFLVTGGLGGLGSDCTRMLCELGANVAVADVAAGNQGRAKLQEQFKSTKDANVEYYTLDVTDEAQAQAVVEAIIKRFGSIHGLVHCAGVALRRQWTTKLSDGVAAFRKTLDINVTGTYIMGAAVADAINARAPEEQANAGSLWSTKEERGVIINFSSIAGHEPTARVVGYGPSKTAVLGLTRSFADFLAPSGIRVNSVSPGLIATPILGTHAGWYQKDLEANGGFPKAPAQPKHISMAVQQLIENEFINGEDVKITGGWRLVSTVFPGQEDPRASAPGIE